MARTCPRCSPSRWRTGKTLGHALFEIVPIATFAVAAGMPRFGRRGRSAMVCLGLLTSSAVLVHLWDGRIEAHFHFFVMVTLLATYEEWFPYVLAFALRARPPRR